MFGSSILKPLFKNVLTSGYVPKLYHSVIMRPLTKGSTAPAAPVSGGRFQYVGPDDTKGFASYCRQTGPAEAGQPPEKIGGCSTKLYRFTVPHRLVFFNALEKRDHETLRAQILKSIMKTNHVTIQRVHVLHEQILSDEAPTGKFKFTDKTFYFAVDFFVLLKLQTDTCIVEISCEGTDNPLSSAGDFNSDFNEDFYS